MKKLLTAAVILMTAAAAFCGEKIIAITADSSVKLNQKVDGSKDVIVIDGSKAEKTSIAAFDLSEFSDTDISIEISGDIKIVDKTGSDNVIGWIVNDFEAKLPELSRGKYTNNTWTKVQGKKMFHVGDNKKLYISPAGINKDNITFYLRNFTVKVTGDMVGVEVKRVSWLDEPSLNEAYKGIFDYIGFATPLNGFLSNSNIQKGLAYQAGCITMENEFKPDFMFAWNKPNGYRDFTGESGNVIKVPVNTPPLDNVNTILGIAKKNGLKMRGHVLVWHSQTPDWFFYEDYDSKKSLVDKDTMNARMEWYIKTILEYIKDWEAKNNNGEHIVIAWDVVNEAISDSANNNNWLRNSGSKWYSVYKDESFIINAFRYANKYAPADVLLAYNDYNEYSTNKTRAMLKLVDLIKATPDARIDVIGMQSHISLAYPGVEAYEKAVKQFIEKGVDVHVTELDIASGGKQLSSEKIADAYRRYFEMFIRNRKTEGKNGIRGVTLWGVNDERSWIYKNGDGVNLHQSPLLFTGNVFCKPAFYAVLEAAQSVK